MRGKVKPTIGLVEKSKGFKGFKKKMKKEKRVGFDLDNVVIDTVKAIKQQEILPLLKEFEEHRADIDFLEMLSLGKKYPVLAKGLATGAFTKDIREKDIMSLAEEDGTEFPTATRFFLGTKWWKDVLVKAGPVEGAIDVLKKIPNKEFVSRRLIDELEPLIEWFKKNNIEIPRENIHLRPDLSISEIEHKKNIIQKCGIQVFYDDLEKIVKEIPQARIFKGWLEVKKDMEG